MILGRTVNIINLLCCFSLSQWQVLEQDLQGLQKQLCSCKNFSHLLLKFIRLHINYLLFYWLSAVKTAGKTDKMEFQCFFAFKWYWCVSITHTKNCLKRSRLQSSPRGFFINLAVETFLQKKHETFIQNNSQPLEPFQRKAECIWGASYVELYYPTYLVDVYTWVSCSTSLLVRIKSVKFKGQH